MTYEQNIAILLPGLIAFGLLWWGVMILVLGLHRLPWPTPERREPLVVIGAHNSGEVLRSTWTGYYVRWHGSTDMSWVHKLDVKRAPAGLFKQTG